MIFTITPNPALDLGGTVKGLIPDEKNYVFDESRFPGGNAINVARWLTRLQLPVQASGFLGGSIGVEVQELLEREGVAHSFVRIKANTRISITVSNLKTQHQTRLSFPGPKIHASEFKSLLQPIAKLPQKSLLVIGGSLPPGFTAAHLNRLILAAERRNIPVIVDVPGEFLRQALQRKILFIKPNLSEFQALIGTKLKRRTSIIAAAREIAADGCLVCVSSVDGGALLVSQGAAWFGRTPSIKVRSTVGAGDSMVAAITAELWKNKVYHPGPEIDALLPRLLTQGLAAAAATLSLPGTTLGSVQQLKKFAKEIQVSREPFKF